MAGWPRPPRARRRGSFDFQIGVTIEFVFIEALDGLSFRQRHPAFAHGPLAIARQPRIEFVRIIFHVFEDLIGGIALDDFLDPPAAFVVQPDMHDMGVAEQVVKIAESLLIRADQKGGQIIRLTDDEFVQLERALG